MKLIQLNTWGGRLDNSLQRFLTNENPDIFCGQEAISYEYGDSILFLPIEQMQTLANLDHQVFGATASFKFMEGDAYFGNVILSKKEIARSETVFTNLEYVEDFNFEVHDYNIRNFVHAVIKHGDKEINVLTHHGFHVANNKDGNSETDQQMNQIADYVESLDGSIILTGDFNLKPTSSSLIRLNTMLKNLSIDYNLTTTRNYLTHKSEVCDYIFVSNDVQIKDFRAAPEIISDHQALVLEFDI